MLTVNMHDAKTRLSELVARAVAGEPFVIARAGKPLVKVEALVAPEKKAPRPIGFAKGRWKSPSDEVWQQMDREIEQMFEDSPPLEFGAGPRGEAAE